MCRHDHGINEIEKQDVIDALNANKRHNASNAWKAGSFSAIWVVAGLYSLEASREIGCCLFFFAGLFSVLALSFLWDFIKGMLTSKRLQLGNYQIQAGRLEHITEGRTLYTAHGILEDRTRIWSYVDFEVIKAKKENLGISISFSLGVGTGSWLNALTATVYSKHTICRIGSVKHEY